MSENSTKNNENSKLIRRANGSERPHDRIDSGAFSEGNVFLFLISDFLILFKSPIDLARIIHPVEFRAPSFEHLASAGHT